MKMANPASPRGLSGLLGILPDPARRTALVVAFVGAGGKTSAIYAIAREFADSGVIVTTTTMLRDPRFEAGRPVDAVLIDPLLATAVGKGETAIVRAARRGAGALVLASGIEADGHKLVGIDPSRVETLRARSDIVLVEADGSRSLPIKAPAAWEPVVPDCADLVVGLIGLDCLGEPLGPQVAHRCEILGPLAGCAIGERIRSEHIVRLIRSSEGLFKGAPPGARRAIVLNKADLAPPGAAQSLLDAIVEGCADLDAIIACSLRDGARPIEIAALRQSEAARLAARPAAELCP